MIRGILTLCAAIAGILAIPYVFFWPIHAVARLIWQSVFR
jgi:hypothetical protein